jgi:hypothetical protein
MMAMSDPAISVSAQTIELVFRLCEQEPPTIDWHVLNMHFARLGVDLIAAGALVETTPSDTIIMPVDLDDKLVEFDWDPDRQAFVGFHPNMGLVEADLRARERYRLDFDWLLRLVAGAAGVAHGQRHVCLVDNLLWDLGDARLRRKKRPILFACRLGAIDELDRVERALIAREGRADGVVLTTSPRISRAMRLPGRHRILPIRDCLDHASSHFALDVDVIAGARPEARPGGQDGVVMSPGGGWIRIHGREYRFRGLVQRSIVEQVHEAWRDGTGRLRTQEVLEAAESSARQLAQAFSGRPEFREIIGYDDGFCWLKVD